MANGLGRGIIEPGMAHATAAQDTDDDAAQAMFGRAEPWSASLDTSTLSSLFSSVMKTVMKIGRRKQRCKWCRQFFKPKAGGRPPLFCSASCRQRAYEKRRWTPYSASDALARDLLPWAAAQRMRQVERHAHMIELIMTGVVPLRDPAQIDGVLDPATPQERTILLQRIEGACQRRADDQSLATIARWRLSRQQPLPKPDSPA